MSEHNRSEEDFLGDYQRFEIDRGVVPLSSEFRDQKGDPLIFTARNIYKERGEISILDAGCGTGRGLLDMRKQLINSGAEETKVLTVGVNDENFSDESLQAEVRDSIKSGQVKYVAGKLQNVRFNNQFDIIWSYEVLIHNTNEDAASAIRNLVDQLNDSGRLVFNLNAEQRSSQVISQLIESLRQTGSFEIFEEVKEKRGQSRVFVQVIKIKKESEQQ